MTTRSAAFVCSVFFVSALFNCGPALSPCSANSDCRFGRVCLYSTCEEPTGLGGGGGRASGGGGGSATGGGAGGGIASGGGGSGGGSGGGTGQSPECAACSGAGQCASGLSCGERRCDGRSACYRSGGSCATIGGVSCQTPSNFETCTAAECGPGFECRGFATLNRYRCIQTCSVDSDCTASQSAFDGQMVCTGSQCFPSCTGLGTCPSGMECQKWTNGTFGYCF